METRPEKRFRDCMTAAENSKATQTEQICFRCKAARVRVVARVN